MSSTTSSVISKKDNTSLWIPNNLKVVCDAIDRGCGTANRWPSNEQFISLLGTLSYVERSVVAHYFCKLPWNVSSVRVLGSLHRLRILTATEYILSQTDEEHIQLVLNDFLETEFDLIANLFICGQFDLMIGPKITEYVDEGIRRLFVDLVKDPKLNNLEYISALKRIVPKDLHTKLVSEHLKIVVSMHKSTTKTAFANFSTWVKQSLDNFELVSNFYKMAVAGSDLEVVKALFSLSSGANFTGWRNYLLLLGMIVKNCQSQCCSFIRKWLKDRLKAAAEAESMEIMAHLLLSIRVVLIHQEEKTETYAKWYKQNIGDMKFVFNVVEFKAMMSILTDLVPYEIDEDYLEVHIKTVISPPVMCSQICRDFKILCRTRIADIADCSSVLELDGNLFSDIE